MRRRRSRGLATIPLLLALSLLVPMFLIFLSRSTTHNRHNYMDRGIRVKRLISANFVADYLRQFSEDFRQDHYMRFWLDRSNIFSGDPVVYSFVGGRSRIKINSDIDPALNEDAVRANRIFVMNSFGAFSRENDFGAGLEAVVQFRQSALRYALISKGPLTVSPGGPLDGTVLTGGAWLGGPATVSTGWTVDRGPLVARNDVAGGGFLSLSAGTTFYYSSTAAVGGVSGGLQTAYLPPESALDPGIYDLTYFETHYSTFVTVDSTWSFFKQDATNTCRFRNQSGVDFTVPISSTFTPILVVKDARLTLKLLSPTGVGWSPGLRQRFTIVNINGDVTLDGPWHYRGSTNGVLIANSETGASVAVLVGGDLRFTHGAVGTNDVVGLFYVAGRTVVDGAGGTHLHGALYTETGDVVNTAGQRLTISADPNAAKNITPGVPERAYLIKHRPLRDRVTGAP